VDQLELSEEQAQVFRDIFRKYIYKKSTFGIIKELEMRGIPSRPDIRNGASGLLRIFLPTRSIPKPSE